MKKYRRRARFTEAEVTRMWERWHQGDSLHTIAHLLDTSHTSVRRHLVASGGIRPGQRTRSRLALTLSEREEISRGMVAGHSLRSIAKVLGRAPSTVSRELQRNGGRAHYRAHQADLDAWERGRRSKRCKLSVNRRLARLVARQLRRHWSPEQIAGWLKRAYPNDESCQVSHETIYRSLFVQARGALNKELLQELRRTRGMRRSRHHTQKTADDGRI